MFTKLSIPQRIQIGLVLAMAFLLVLGSNRLDQRHFSTVQTAVNSVYKDRVVVQDFIYKLNNIFHTKELRFILENDHTVVDTENQKAQNLLEDFSATKLTLKEKKVLGELNIQFDRLQKLEDQIIESPGTLHTGVGDAAVKILKKIELNLDDLALIQLEESEQMTQLSNKSLGMNILLSKLEVAFLILIGIAMLALIFYPIKTMHAVNMP